MPLCPYNHNYHYFYIQTQIVTYEPMQICMYDQVEFVKINDELNNESLLIYFINKTNLKCIKNLLLIYECVLYIICVCLYVFINM